MADTKGSALTVFTPVLSDRGIGVDDPLGTPASGGYTFTSLMVLFADNISLGAARVTSGTFADARIAQSSVTQHVAAIDHDALLGFVANEHIDWTADQGATDIHSGNIPDLSATYATVSHTHTAADVTDFAEVARDTIGAALVEGANVTITVDDINDTITIASSGGGSIAVSDEGTQVLATPTDINFVGAGVSVADDGDGTATVTVDGGGYTDEAAQDAVGGILVDSAEIDFTYDDATPSITAALVAGSIDESKLDTSVTASLDLADTASQPGHAHAASEITSGTLAHERGGLEADVSAFSGLIKISGGATSQAVAGTDYAAVSHSHVQADLTGLGTADSPQFAGINLGHATDTTLARAAAGQVTIEGVTVLTASNTATVTNKSIDAAQLTGTVSVNRFNGGTGADTTTFLRGDGTWVTPSGTGTVDTSGTPAVTQVAYFSDADTITGESTFTWDPATDTLTVPKIVIGGTTFDGTNQLTDPDADRLMGWDDSVGTTTYFSPVNGLEISGTDLQVTANLRGDAIEFIIDGAGSAITTGQKGHLEVPWACTITAARMLADQSGSIVVDIWKDTYAAFPPTDADTITASAPPTISAAVKSEDATLTGWTTALAAGDILAFNVDSASTVTRVTLVLKVTKT